MGFCYSYIVKKRWIIGIDEVGRGPLAGPVYVCACAIRADKIKTIDWRGLTDSKKMTARNRELWFVNAKELQSLGVVKYAIGTATARMIDKKGISRCIRSCIASALGRLTIDPQEASILLDGGLRAPQEYFDQQTIIKGDQKERAISLASVIAKVSRDAYMNKLHKKHPEYHWDQNKGYGTASHRQMIKEYGTTSYHRVTFLSNIVSTAQKGT